MAPKWAADIKMDLALARAVLAQDFPALDRSALVPFGEGWDNVLFRLNEGLLFRFPRRVRAIVGVLRECSVLPRLHQDLRCPIPVPIHLGLPSTLFAAPYYGYAPLPGEELLLVQLPEDGAHALAHSLGTFLAQLHQPEVHARFVAELPVDVHGPLTTASLGARASATLRGVNDARVTMWCAEIDRRTVVAQNSALAPCARLVHGDLHLRHMLIDADARLSGIIDWGDMHSGHPAIDLSLYWTALTGKARQSFLTAYGPVPVAWLEFAQAMGLYSCAALALYAQDKDQPRALAGALRGLRCALT